MQNQNLEVINYGVGMACSFFEGYLVHVIPNDGHNFFGLENNILVYEGKHTVVFPVKKLLIVVTKSLFCPPDLKHFNKINKDLPYLDDCSVSLMHFIHCFNMKFVLENDSTVLLTFKLLTNVCSFKIIN